MLQRSVFLSVSLLFIIMMAGAVQAQPGRVDKGPKVGTEAPTFSLKSQDDKEEFDLASFKDKKPVVLFFGSYS